MDDLRQMIRGDVDVSDEILDKYDHDASIFKVRPEAVIYPQDVEDIQNLVKYASWRRQEGASVSLTARNGGTCMSGGSLTESYVVDMSRHFGWVGEPENDGRTIRVQGGAMHAKVEEATHPKGLLFPPYTSSHLICGIGGMLGNNASGEKSIKFGPTSHNVRSMKLVLSNGEHVEFGPLNREQLEAKKAEFTLEGHIYREMDKLLAENEGAIQRHHPRVKKNAAGYALWDVWNADKTEFNLVRMLIGSQGTLGITTDAELMLVPLPKASRMVVMPISNLAELAVTVQTILRFAPDTCETFDSNTYELAKVYHPEDAARASLADGQHLVVFGIFTGDSQEEADGKAAGAKDALEKIGRTVTWVDDPAILESFLLIRRKSFALLLEHPTPTSRAMPFLEDTIVPIEHYGEFLAALEVILGEYDMKYTYAGHIGDGSIRLIPLVDMDAPDAPDKIMELSERVYDLVFAFGGSMSVDHNDGLIRTSFLERMYGPEMAALFKRVKDLFDPEGIFNPGKKVDGSLEYAKAHIVRSNT